MASGKSPEARYAIQSWYLLKIDEKRKLHCDEVIKIPLASLILDPANKYMVPCIVITTDFMPVLAAIKIEIETNEGFTIEPIKVVSDAHFGWVYILALPPKTTGLKNVKVFAIENEQKRLVQNDLAFEIMYPPYDYEGAGLDNVSLLAQRNENATRDLNTQLEALTARVEALEQKP